MKQVYNLVVFPFSNQSAPDISGLAARALRSVRRTAKVMQYPLVDGGSGTIEQVVTATLGSFLEVEATASDGKQQIVPMGFAGKDGALAIIEMNLIAPEIHHAGNRRSKNMRFTGTTFGIGELIRDALDEGAHNVLLGWDEPIARDAGFGMAQALGIKFYDKKEKELDFRTSTPIDEVIRIDITGKPFSLLSSKFFAARSTALISQKGKRQITVEDALMLDELTRIAEIYKRDTGLKIPTSAIRSTGSYMEFGLTAFLNADIRSGIPIILEASEYLTHISLPDSVSILIVEGPEQLLNMSSTEILMPAEIHSSSKFSLISSQIVSPHYEKKLRSGFPHIRSIYSLSDVPLFVEPLGSDASELEHRTLLQMQFEKLFMRIADEL